MPPDPEGAQRGPFVGGGGMTSDEYTIVEDTPDGDTGVSLSATARLRPEGARDMADALREMADLMEGRE